MWENLQSLHWHHNEHVGVSNHQPVNSPHKGPVTWKLFPFDDVNMEKWLSHQSVLGKCAVIRHQTRYFVYTTSWIQILTVYVCRSYCDHISNQYIWVLSIMVSGWAVLMEYSSRCCLSIGYACRRVTIAKVCKFCLLNAWWINTEMKMMSFWWHFHCWLQQKLPLLLQPVMMISSKWYFRFSKDVLFCPICMWNCIRKSLFVEVKMTITLM